MTALDKLEGEAMQVLNSSLHGIKGGSIAQDPNAQELIRLWFRIFYRAGERDAIREMRAMEATVRPATYGGVV